MSYRWAQLGWTQPGWTQLGWTQLGWTQPGWTQLGEIQVGIDGLLHGCPRTTIFILVVAVSYLLCIAAVEQWSRW